MDFISGSMQYHIRVIGAPYQIHCSTISDLEVTDPEKSFTRVRLWCRTGTMRRRASCLKSRNYASAEKTNWRIARLVPENVLTRGVNGVGSIWPVASHM